MIHLLYGFDSLAGGEGVLLPLRSCTAVCNSSGHMRLYCSSAEDAGLVCSVTPHTMTLFLEGSMEHENYTRYSQVHQN